MEYTSYWYFQNFLFSLTYQYIHFFFPSLETMEIQKSGECTEIPIHSFKTSLENVKRILIFKNKRSLSVCREKTFSFRLTKFNFDKIFSP
jgi:hypothetical protein